MGQRKAIIAGAGPSGLSCAIYLSRAGWEVNVYSDEERSLSSLASAPMIYNYPGFPNGISGMDLLSLFTEQAEKSGASIHSEGIVDLNTDDLTYRLTDGFQYGFRDSKMIVAVGRKPKSFVCNGSDCLDVHTCAICDGGLYGKNDDLIVIGGGDSAIGSALYLSNLVKSVRVFVRRDTLRATNRKDLSDLLGRSNAQIIYHTVINDISMCESGGYYAEAYDKNDGNKTKIRFDGIFACTGYENVDTIKVCGICPDSVLYCIGDCSGISNQVLTACSSGAQLALDLIENRR